MFCSNCGKTISDQAGHCPECGQPARVAQAALSQKKKSTAAILCLILMHRFYVGKVGSGIAQLLSCGIGVGAIWGLVDFITILQGKFRDANDLLIK